MSQLIVGLTPALARALARGDRTEDTARLRELTTRAGVDLAPQSERSLDDADDAEEVVWFSTESDDADDIGTELLRIPGVTAAYVTPPQGPP